MNFQDVIREVYDGDNKVLKTSATVTGSSQVTVTPQAAWPDPKTYIGLVTVTGNLSASLGGNITLNPSPNFIGIVTVANSQANTGNVTLNTSPNYIGLVTTTAGSAWPDPKTYIGLVTVTGNLSASLAGNITLNSSPNFIGIVTVANPGGANSGNVTLNPSPNYIGVVSVAGMYTDDSITPNISGMVAMWKDSADIPVASSQAKPFPTLVLNDAGSGAYIRPGTGVNLDTNAILGSVTVMNPISIAGNITLSDPKGFIGLVTVVGSLSAAAGNVTLDPGSKTGIVGNVTLTDSKGFIGLVTIGNSHSAPSDSLGSGNDSLFTLAQGMIYDSVSDNIHRMREAHSSNLTLSTGVTATGIYGWDGTTNRRIVIGGDGRLQGNVTVNNPVSIAGNLTLSDPKGFIGLVTVVGSLSAAAGNVTLNPSPNAIGIVTIANPANIGNVTLNVSPNFIGLVTVGNTVAVNHTQLAGSAIAAGAGTSSPGTQRVVLSTDSYLANSNGYIGLVTVTQVSSARTITGNVTANTYNAGTTKTLIPLPFTLLGTSQATIFVASGGNAIFKVTDILVSSNATTRISFKSGVTYLTGNASIGISLNPGGGWVQHGSPDSPVYIGLASGSALVLEKNDITAAIGGQVMYFQE